MRITGLATGLDMDEIIKNSMKPYRIKVDQTTQKKDVVEIKQKLYRDIMSDATKFLDKYLDLGKSDSLLKTNNYKSVIFTSSSDSVTVTSSSGAKPGNYTITGNPATATKAVITDNVKNSEKLVINGKEFTLKGGNENEIAKDLNEQLEKQGMNITVRYSQLAGNNKENKSGLILESTVLGKDATFTLGGKATSIAKLITNGKDATPAKVTGFTIDEIRANGKISINGKEIKLGIVEQNIDEDIVSLLNHELKAEDISVSMDDSKNITFSSTKPGSTSLDPNIEIGGKTGTFTSGDDATPGSLVFDKSELTSGTWIIGGKAIKIDLSEEQYKTNENQEKYLNDLFEKNGVGVKATVNDNEITLTSTAKGASSTFDISSTSGQVATGGADASIIIKDDKGGVYTHAGNSNTLTLDNVTFTFNGVIPESEKATINGKTNVTETKDKLVGFINDYNTLIEKLNTIISTKHDKGYMPLTAEQKKEMSESEIKLWNEKVEKGQLYKDSVLTDITNSLKGTMRTVMDGTGFNLEKIGIKPIKDYSGTKNGTFAIDEEKLTKSLEDDIENVMDLFIANPKKSDAISSSEYTSKTGILYQLKDTIETEFKKSSSILSNKVGLEGTSTFSNNELTKSISDYEKKIKDMEKDFTRREQALYTKYATLEKMMNNLNSQQSNLMSQLGLS